MSKLALAYWDIRGLAEPARAMLAYGGVAFEDVRYKCADVPPYDRSSWLDVKFTLGLDFPNLPYMIDGDLKITESRAIYRYIARKVGLMPESVIDQTVCEMLEGVVDSVRMSFTSTCYSQDFETKQVDLKENQQKKLVTFEKYLENRKFLGGEKPVYVDFSFFESMDHHRIQFPDIFDPLPNIKKYMERFELMEKFAAYRKSDSFKKFPINNPSSKWGYKPCE